MNDEPVKVRPSSPLSAVGQTEVISNGGGVKLPNPDSNMGGGSVPIKNVGHQNVTVVDNQGRELAQLAHNEAATFELRWVRIS